MLSFFDNILYEALPYSFVSLGLIFTYRYLRIIDLTFASSFILGASVIGYFISNGYSVPLGFAVAVFFTILLSLLTLVQIRILKLNEILAGLLTSIVGFSISLLFTEGTLAISDYQGLVNHLKELDRSYNAGVVPLHPFQISFFLALTIICKLLADIFFKSEAGLLFRSIEDQQSYEYVFKSKGLSSNLYHAFGIVTGNLLSLLSGIIILFKENQVTSNRGFDALLTVIAGYLLGTIIFESGGWEISKRKKSFLAFVSRIKMFNPTTATVLGLIFYFVLLTVTTRLDLPSSFGKILVVVIILLALLLSKIPELKRTASITRKNKTFPSEKPSLLATEVEVSYPSNPSPVEVLKNFGIEVNRGELVLLQGKNGTGKSTLLRYLSEIIPGSGKVYLDMETGSASARSTRVQYIHQDAAKSTPACLSTGEYLSLVQISGKPKWFSRYKSIQPDTKFFNNHAANFVGELSGGQRQILQLYSLSREENTAQYILIDEPLTYLDEGNANMCVGLIQKMLKANKGIVLVQHDLQPNTQYDNSQARTTLSNMIARVVSMDGIES